jgi:hypothetical protein
VSEILSKRDGKVGEHGKSGDLIKEAIFNMKIASFSLEYSDRRCRWWKALSYTRLKKLYLPV